MRYRLYPRLIRVALQFHMLFDIMIIVLNRKSETKPGRVNKSRKRKSRNRIRATGGLEELCLPKDDRSSLIMENKQPRTRSPRRTRQLTCSIEAGGLDRACGSSGAWAEWDINKLKPGLSTWCYTAGFLTFLVFTPPTATFPDFDLLSTSPVEFTILY